MLQRQKLGPLSALLIFTLAFSGCNKVKARNDLAFMGDSITQMWTLPKVNLGIYGQTTAQMLQRFPSDVLQKNLHTVVILGGTNDVLLGVDPNITIANLGNMADIASSHGIEPVLCEIPPIYASHSIHAPQVETLNQRIKSLAAEKKLKLVDYYDAIKDHPGYFSDGVHLKRRGYLVMDWTLSREVHLFQP
jgi:lysophospholipase L1-like esterase